MSLKAELETWAAALAAYDAENFEESLELFTRIADSSKIFTNIGLIYATLGDHETAVEQFSAATQLDQYLAVAYFQRGVSNFLLNKYDLAIQDFEEALAYLRGNENINYEQLGLKFKLYPAEVLFNRGLCLIYMDREIEGMAEMEEARKLKVTDEHSVIDEAVQDKGQGYTVFSIPVGILYRPAENKMKNAKQKDYMGKAKLVASSDASDAYTTFTGVTRLKQGISPQGVFVDDPQPASDLSRSVTLGRPSKPAADPIAPLQRSKTTINIATNALERTRPSAPATTTDTVRPAAGDFLVTEAPTRGLSLRRQNSSPDVRKTGNQVQKAPGSDAGPRMTEFYDDYIESYRATPTLPAPPAASTTKGSERGNVANWARTNANPNNYPPSAISRAPSRSSPSATGLRRKHTRNQTAPSRSQRTSSYEEEEGYASGDYEELSSPLAKIRIKVHYNDDIRGMTLTPDVSFNDFMDKLCIKFEVARLDVKFKDEDGGKVSLKDESDYEMAIETIKETSKGKAEGRLEIWCADD